MAPTIGSLAVHRAVVGDAQHPLDLDGLVVPKALHLSLGAGAAAQVGVHHVALDRPGADQRHLDHQVVEAARLEARQRVHLRAALHLEDADRVGATEVVVHGLVGRVERREVDRGAAGLADVLEAVLEPLSLILN